MALLGSLHDAPCVNTTQGSGGCILTSAIIKLIWNPGITVTDSLVIARGCFQEVFGDGTVQCSVLSSGCCRSPRIIWDPGWYQLVQLIDCGFASALLEDKQSRAGRTVMSSSF